MKVNFNEEKKLWKQGYEFVIGLDEAGRGPLAGPVIAVAVLIIPALEKLLIKKHSDILQNIRMSSLARDGIKQIKQTNKTGFIGLFSGIRDSKKLSEKQREYFYDILTSHENIKWGIGVVSEKVIDKINILEATKLAMSKAIKGLIFTPLNNSDKAELPQAVFNGMNDLRFRSQFLLIDGNFGLNDVKIPQKSIIKGDEKVFSIAAAGIIAKVARDRIMRKMHKKHPQYGFDKHKGYGTSEHMRNLQHFGPCKTHRKTFYPVSSYSS